MFELNRRLKAMEDRLASLESELAAYRAALTLTDDEEMPRRKPGRPKRDQQTKEAQA
jgi:hypothetical protein